jgi:hypothetical protein
MTKIIHALTIACVLVLSLMTSNGLSGTNYIANASSHQDEKPHPFNNDKDDHHSKNSNTCPSQSFLDESHLKGATKILDITYTVKNDEDSGVGGYWALDHFNEHLKVWKLSDGSFYAVKKYDGIFAVPTGGPNPADGSHTQTESAFGNTNGGYVATFTGTFTPGTNPTSGNIGIFNFGGTMSDILLKTYGNGQTGATPTFDWTSAYFSGFDNFVEPHWGWSYKLDPEFQSSTSVNQWCNYNSADGGNSGDILT